MKIKLLFSVATSLLMTSLILWIRWSRRSQVWGESSPCLVLDPELGMRYPPEHWPDSPADQEWWDNSHEAAWEDQTRAAESRRETSPPAEPLRGRCLWQLETATEMFMLTTRMRGRTVWEEHPGEHQEMYLLVQFNYKSLLANAKNNVWILELKPFNSSEAGENGRGRSRTSRSQSTSAPAATNKHLEPPAPDRRRWDLTNNDLVSCCVLRTKLFYEWIIRLLTAENVFG